MNNLEVTNEQRNNTTTQNHADRIQGAGRETIQE